MEQNQLVNHKAQPDPGKSGNYCRAWRVK